MANLIEKIYFPREGKNKKGLPLNIGGLENSDNSEIEKILRRAKISVYTCAVGGILVLGLYFFFIGSQNTSVLGAGFHLTFVAGLASLIATLPVRKSIKYYYIPAVVVMLVLLTIVPERIYSAGGLYAPIGIFSIVSILFSGVFFERAGILLTTIFWLCFTVFLHYQHSLGVIPLQNPKVILISVWTIVVGIAVIAGIAFGNVATQDSYRNRVADIEREATMKLFSAALSHEINNPLFTAKLFLGKAEDQGKFSESDYAAFTRALNRIEEVILGVQSIEDGSTDFEIVKYEGETKMVRILGEPLKQPKKKLN